MSSYISRDEALRLVSENVKTKSMYLHMLEVEAIMRALARRFGDDEELWGLTGLLHDIDYEYTKDDPSRHTLVAEEMLKGKVPENVLRAIKAHNHENTGVEPISPMEYALIASDGVSGLLVACALVMPSKKLDEVKVKTVAKKFKQKDFARRVRRDRIRMCEKLGLSLEEFFEISLNALKEISSELGL